MGWTRGLVRRGAPSSSKVVSSSSYSSARGADSTAEDVEDQVKDRNDDLGNSISSVDRYLNGETYSHYGADDRHHHARDSRDDGVDDTTDG